MDEFLMREEERLGDRYVTKLDRYNRSVATWQKFDRDGKRSVRELFALMDTGTPTETCHDPMVALDEWRAFRGPMECRRGDL